MAYVSLAEFKSYVSELSGGVQSSYSANEDIVLQLFIDQAAAEINNKTSRAFETVTATRSYNAESVYERVLILDTDCLGVTTLTNGNGAVITAYTLLPRNSSPKFGIELPVGASWSTTADITVAGTWGYSATASADCKRVVMRLAYFYWQKRTNTGENSIFGDGVVTVAANYPADVQDWIKNHQRRVYA